jgi:hypothetical protein
MGRLGGHGTWPRRAGLRQVNALATDSSEAGSGQGGSRWLQWCDGNVEAMAHAGVLSSDACPEQRGREALNSGHAVDGAGDLRHDEEELGGARGS